MVTRSRLVRVLQSSGRRMGAIGSARLAPCHAISPARCFATSAPRLLSQSQAVQHLAKLTSETYPGLTRDAKYASLTADDVAYFKDLLGGEQAVIDGTTGGAEDDLKPFNEDWMHKYRGQGRLVLKPASTEDVSQILKYCNERKLAVVPQGGNTGLVGGSVPIFDEIVINMSRMNQIHSFDEVSGSLVLDAGCILEVADQYLAERGYIFPLDLGAKGSCHVGGTVATNAGGLRLLRYGSLHGNVLGMEAVLPDGTVMNDLCALRKNNTGYDLKQLFIGGEGTIGIITKLVIQCPQRSAAVNVAYFGLESYEKAQLAFREAKKQLGEILSAFELMDSRTQQIVHKIKGEERPLEGDHPFYCLIETSGSNGDHDYEKLEKFLEDVLTKEIVVDGVVAQGEGQAKALWSWRESITECIGHGGGVYKYDVSIPLAEMYSLVEDVKARMGEAGLIGETEEHPVSAVVGYGHMGDSNLHLNVAVRRYDAKVEEALEPFVYEWIEKRNGSISAEHGLGLAKKKYVQYSRNETVIGLMKQIKKLYDPCSNERPFCQNCISSGRTCEGYERERVFITGTPETKGRVASHPKKTTPSKKPKASPSPSVKASDEPGSSSSSIFSGPQLFQPLAPLTSAWDDYVRLTPGGQGGTGFPALITALQTNLQSVARLEAAVGGECGGDGSAAGLLSAIQFPPYAAAELLPVADDAFGMNAQCFVRQKATNSEHDSTESYCAFLFEMSIALLSRRDTFLRAPEWTTIPWDQHPKSALDQLFDIILQLPAIFEQMDRIIHLQATLARRTQAQELLHHCLVVEAQFRQWLQEAYRGTEEHPYPFWAEELRSPGGAIPFANAYTFKDGVTGLMFVYYWMAMIPFHRCIEHIHMAIFQPVVDAYPNMWPELPPNLQIDPAHYQDGRELAANICRGLDSALNSTVQPDLLLGPMTVAMDFYRDVNAASQDGVLEILWLDGFKKRLWAKAQAVTSVLQAHKWSEVAKF
ncbi:D-lactate dehydrogenase (cytochrome) [Trichoderma harzianum]|uniref:D-lactate dehydrogenase (cytochrome) n=1 Tax=Trichoderma harzianum TaxID=5544 RepID=A0A0F9XQF3_TRIHA|nr:D-lactate dehydrogenase (cytochrome) [Trichoderma harzianum]